MIASCKAFVDAYLDDFATDAIVERSGPTSRRRNPTKQIEGWRLATERERSLSSQRSSASPANDSRDGEDGGHLDLRDSANPSLEIVLVPTGEIFGQWGRPRLTATEITANPWAVPVWMTDLKDRYEISRWPTEAEDLRRLAIDFHTLRRDSLAQLTRVSGSESAAMTE